MIKYVQFQLASRAFDYTVFLHRNPYLIVLW